MLIDISIDELALSSTPEASPHLALKPAHFQRLKFLFSKGRPIQCTNLTQIDLDLIALGLLVNPTQQSAGYDATSSLAITEQGVTRLKGALDRRRAACDIHHSLGSRLAHWLREAQGRMTWENATFHRDWTSRTEANDVEGWSEVRVDVMASTLTPTARLADLPTYEVKVSLADFKADMSKPLKIKASREIAQSAWYCTPEGLVTAEMVPADFGLLYEIAPGDFRVAKRAKRKSNFMPHPDTLMALVRRRATLPESSL